MAKTLTMMSGRELVGWSKLQSFEVKPDRLSALAGRGCRKITNAAARECAILVRSTAILCVRHHIPCSFLTCHCHWDPISIASLRVSSPPFTCAIKHPRPPIPTSTYISSSVTGVLRSVWRGRSWQQKNVCSRGSTWILVLGCLSFSMIVTSRLAGGR